MRRNSINSAYGLKTALTIVFSDHDFLQKDQNCGDLTTP